MNEAEKGQESGKKAENISTALKEENLNLLQDQQQNPPQSPLAGGAATAAAVKLTTRDLRNVSREIDRIYQAPEAHMHDYDDVLALACGRLCLDPRSVRAAMGMLPRNRRPPRSVAM